MPARQEVEASARRKLGQLLAKLSPEELRHAVEAMEGMILAAKKTPPTIPTPITPDRLTALIQILPAAELTELTRILRRLAAKHESG
jgi:hypothetical protein